MSVVTFGTMPNGRDVKQIALRGGSLTAHVLTYGAILQDLRLDGHDRSLVLGFEQFAPYLTSQAYLGATVGRCANRVARGHLEIDGTGFQLDRNFIGKHCLHGGRQGLSETLWTIEQVSHESVTLSAQLADGDMGFPGAMAVRQSFTLMDGGVLDFQIEATSDAPTLCNIAHHSYFCLDDSSDILEHRLQVEADHYLPVDEECIPTGEVAPVEDSFFDFRMARRVGDCSKVTELDHNFCLAREKTPLRHIVSLASDRSKIRLDVSTTEPGLQVYDGAMMDVRDVGQDGKRLKAYAGIALEPQIWPDANHHRDFPQALLRPGETYRQQTQFALRTF